MNSGEKWVANNKDVIKKMQVAKAEGRLYVASQGKTNLVCDACGETNVRFHVVSICDNKAEKAEDPMSGEVYVFGASCFKAVKKAIEEKSKIDEKSLLEAAPLLLAACEAAHEALDRMFAHALMSSPKDKPFDPSKCGQPWEAMLKVNDAIARAKKLRPYEKS